VTRRLFTVLAAAASTLLAAAAPAFAASESSSDALGTGGVILYFVVIPLGGFLLIAFFAEPSRTHGRAVRRRVAQVPSGNTRRQPFTDGQVRDISRACASAAHETGLRFSVYVGPVDGDIRDHAEKLHAALGADASRAVLVAVAPGDRQLEIVTGKESARRLSDRACALAALSMTTAFSGGDLVGGLVTGLRMLADSCGRALPSA
jgi:hypothetical protein